MISCCVLPGTQLIQELIAEGCYAVTRYEPILDKIMRLHAQTAMIENGFVHLPENASWLAEYLHELTVFPNGKTEPSRAPLSATCRRILAFPRVLVDHVGKLAMRDIGVSVRYRLVPAEIACTGKDRDSLAMLVFYMLCFAVSPCFC